MYEASDLLLGDHLYEKSDAVKWIDAAQPHKRKRRVKKHSELTIACNDNPDNTNIFEDNMIDDFYPDRPEAMNDVCRYDFVKLYRYNGKDNNGKRRYCKLCKPVIPNHVVYDPNKEGQSDNYYYLLLLLFRKEEELIGEGETPEQSYARHVSDNALMNEHYDRLQQILKAQGKMKEINECREEEKNDNAKDNEPDDGLLHVMGEAKLAMKDVQDLQDNGSKSVDLQQRISMLNSDQLRIFSKIKNHMLHQYQHETNQCQCDNLKPLHMFFSGVRGTGKSFLIETIRAQVKDIWKENNENLTCAIAAPTGLAAFNVGGVTIHRLFQLPIEHESNTMYWCLGKMARKILYVTWNMIRELLRIFGEVELRIPLERATLAEYFDACYVSI